MAYDNANLEHCLHQKLTLMANAVARISSVKSQLRNSAERTRKDISNSIDHQLSCIRAREQELLFSLERIVAEKEQKLCEQQEQLNQAIGACQQSLECVLQNGLNGGTNSNSNVSEPANMMKMLFKMNTLELKPKDTSDILYEFDPSDLRRDIAVFGKVLAVDHHQVKAAAESLPMDVEHYEDDAFLSHKSVLRLSRRTPPSSLKENRCESQPPLSESINYWLTQVKSFNSDCADEFDIEFIRDRIASMSGSSFDMLSNKDTDSSSTGIFNSHFTRINEQPTNHWLRNEASKNLHQEGDISNLSELTTERAAKKANKRKADVDVNVKDENLDAKKKVEKGFAFEDVIRSIQFSKDDDWLLRNGLEAERSKSAVNFSAGNIFDWQRKFSAENELDVKFAKNLHDRINSTKQDILPPSRDFGHWLKNFPTVESLERRPANDTLDEFSTWESVLAWKKILEKIHSSEENDWLAQTSQNIADNNSI